MERDTEDNNFFDHARSHDFNLGRFVSVDKVGGHAGDPQSWNRYAYSHDNPLRYTDPTGMCIWDGCLVEAAIVAVGAVFIGSEPANAPTSPETPTEPNSYGMTAITGAAVTAGIVFPSTALLPGPAPRTIDDPNSLRGATPQQVKDVTPENWESKASQTGGGERLNNPSRQGDQVRIMPGDKNQSTRVKQGPYVIVSQNGVKSGHVPLAGNPVIERHWWDVLFDFLKK
jgi:RHS repeat-associated protein